MWILRQDYSKLMWGNKTFLNILNASDIRKFSCGGVLLGSILLTNQGQDEQKKPWTIEYPKVAKKNDVLLSRKIVSDLDHTGLGLRLYQYQTCPYCCKVRAFLDYYGFSYEVVEVNPVTKAQIKFSKDYKKVPLLKTACCDKPLVESSLIISVLSTFLHQKKIDLNDSMALYPSHVGEDPVTKKPITVYPNKFFVMREDFQVKSQSELQSIREEREWREWVDEHFIHLISPNVYRSWEEALETFKYFDKVGEWERNFPTWERYLAIYMGAAVMCKISKTLKKRHNITDERQAMLDAFNSFLKAKGDDRRFMGGDEPNLGDLALFGAINSFAGCRTFKEMRKQIPNLSKWFDDVQQAVVERKGSKLLEAKCNTSVNV